MIATGAGAGVGAGMIASGALGIAGELKQNYEHSLTPPQSRGNTNAGDICFASGSMSIPAYKMSIRSEYAHTIDDYFSRFGYKINKLEMPNINGRTYWNYIEIGASEEIGHGTVPSKYMDIINNACRKGITIWHDNANIGNYDLNNTIVS